MPIINRRSNRPEQPADHPDMVVIPAPPVGPPPAYTPNGNGHSQPPPSNFRYTQPVLSEGAGNRASLHTPTQNPSGPVGAKTGSRSPGLPLSRASRADMEHRLHSNIIAELRDNVDLGDPIAVRTQVEEIFNRLMTNEDVVLNRTDRAKLFERVCAEILGYGPIQQLINDDTISEIMVNGPHQVWIEQQGKLNLTDISFRDDEHVMRIIARIVAPLGRRIDESSPMVDARLPDGSRVNALIPPLSLIGPVLTIRKFARVPMTMDDLVRNGSLSQHALIFLQAAVRGGLNIVVAGGTSSGKTTLLNALSSFIPNDERIITIEDAAELQLQQIHVIPLESRPASIEGQNGVSIRDLVVNALRMRPDRIIVGECREKEALDMLQAMNTGHDGCMTTIHSNGPRDTLSRIETMAMMAASELPLQAIREQISSAFDLVVYMERLDDGSRKVSFVTEVLGFEQQTILMQNVFELRWIERNGQQLRELVPTGLRPQVMKKIERARIYLAPDFFVAPPQMTTAHGRGT